MNDEPIGTPNDPGAEERVRCSIDLCVYGGTPSGIFTAVAAARMGLSVILIEPSPFLGGLITSGLNATDIGGPAVIRGLTREFYRRCGSRYGREIELRPESKVAEAVLSEMLQEASQIQVIRAEIVRLRKEGTALRQCELSNGPPISAKVFVDATYEGDLLPLAGVSFRVGREARDEFHEPHGGRTQLRHMLPAGGGPISALGEDGKLIRLIKRFDGRKPGEADEKLQAYSFRLTLTDDPDLRASIPEPSSYDPADFELFRRIARAASSQLHQVTTLFPGVYGKSVTYRSGYFNLAEIAGGKRDMNSGHIAPLNLPHVNEGWLDASRLARKELYQQYLEYTLRVLHFIRSDETVPPKTRAFFSQFGLSRDEYLSTEHFPPALYVREGRRLVGERVFTELDIERGNCGAEDAVAIGKYSLDCKPTQWTTTRDGLRVAREGMFFFNHNKYYELPYWIMTPKPAECTNLLVPVGASASHVGFASIRMEPHWMQLGEVAGVAAGIATRQGIPVQEVRPAEVRVITGYTPQSGSARKPDSAKRT